jgi:hypothetical protein
MRNVTRPQPLALAAVALLLAAAAPAAASDRPAAALLEPAFGALLPAGSWVAGNPPSPIPPPTRWDRERPFRYADILDPAFTAGLSLGYLMPVGGGPSCCRLGPEVGFAFVYWDATDPPVDVGGEYYEGQDLTAAQFRLVVAMRLVADYSWGYILGRLGAGPEVATGKWYEDFDFDGDIGAAILGGTGIGFRLNDYFGISILASLIASFHDQDTDADDAYDGAAGGWMGYRAISIDLSAAATFLL